MKWGIVFWGLLGICACSSAPKSGGKAGPEANQRPVQLPLKATEAALRSQQLVNVAYTLWFGLDESRDIYDGRVAIQFDLTAQARSLASETFIDFYDGKLSQIKLNGHLLSDPNSHEVYDGNRIHLPNRELRDGNNRIEISFTHPYSRHGAGLHRFQDPVDNQIYTYSNFEPYDAHQMFPCFDQPDLKATFELSVQAPVSWEVISNTAENEVTQNHHQKQWSFPRSARMSTYVFAMHAGPYSKWQETAGAIPIRLFARKSLAKHIESQEWLDITRRGLQWYGATFAYPYPYGKYDQVLVPDFNAGAMENIGAVTFSERFVFRSKTTIDGHRDRANVILHEMAHMWFGDLVTMKWWNGLWLNESFATFMATWAVDQATAFKGSWQSFASSKESTYREDQYVTTHPVEANVPDTDQATANFDGITYGKGASSLKQLMHFIGEDAFKLGVQNYFKNFAYQNTTILDFMGSLAKTSGKDLDTWRKRWLETSGVNTIEPNWSCNQGKISSFTLAQNQGNGDSVLRPHRTRIGFYAWSDHQLKLQETLDLAYSDAVTSLPEAIGKPCPAFVFSNEGDFDYVRVLLDPTSRAVVQSNLGKIQKPFSRQLLWSSLWDMVRESKLSAQDFLDTVMSQNSGETETLILGRVHGNAFSRGSFGSALKYLTPDLVESYQTKIENYLRSGLKKAPAGSDLQLVWLQTFLTSFTSKSGAKTAKALLAGKEKLPKLKIEQERRWEIIRALARNNEVSNLIDLEAIKDPTDSGKKEAITANALIPTVENKTNWMNQILTGKMKSSDARQAMSAFFLFGQEDSTRFSIDHYFSAIPKIVGKLDDEYVSNFSKRMYPANCDAKSIAQATDTLNQDGQLPAYVSKALKIGKQEDERCQLARKMSATARSLSSSR